jgi:hypothetical protein
LIVIYEFELIKLKTMKTKVISLRWLVPAGLFFVFVFSAKAGNGDRVNVIPEQNGKLVLEVFNQQESPMTFQIISNSDQEDIYNKDLHRNSYFGSILNLSNLPDGDYTLDVKMGNETFEDKIELARNNAVLLEENKYFEPVFRDGDHQLGLMMINPKGDDVQVSFYQGSDKFFEDNPNIQGSFLRKYNLKNLERGDYQVEVDTGSKSYLHTIHVK